MHRVPALWLIPAVILSLLTAMAAAGDKIWESEKGNVVLRVPDEGSTSWAWLAYEPEWAQSGVVKGAIRTLRKLKSGAAASGEGAMLHLAIRDASADEKLSDLLAADDARRFFLRRFGPDPPTLEQEESTVGSGSSEDGHPCLILRAEGSAPNLRSKTAKCLGVLIATKFKDKLYLLRMYAFPTRFDEEGLSLDLDTLEVTALELINTKRDPEPAPAERAEAEDEKSEPETIEHREQGWCVTIPGKLERQELTETEDAENLALKIVHSDRGGGAMLYLYASPSVQYVNGVRARAPDIVSWITSDWWSNFTITHDKGDIFTYRWPKRPEGKNPTFLTLPDLADEKGRIGVITGKRKRPVAISSSDATKMRFVERPTRRSLGKKGTGREARRGCLEGIRSSGGKETVLRYAWRSSTHSYRLFVVFTDDGYRKYGSAIRKTLESFEFGIKFK